MLGGKPASKSLLVGYGVVVAAQTVIFPVFSLHTTLVQILKMGGIFTIMGLARSFALRRMFERLRANARWFA